jgi:hypothetical protein
MVPPVLAVKNDDENVESRGEVVDAPFHDWTNKAIGPPEVGMVTVTVIFPEVEFFA